MQRYTLSLWLCRIYANFCVFPPKSCPPRNSTTGQLSRLVFISLFTGLKRDTGFLLFFKMHAYSDGCVLLRSCVITAWMMELVPGAVTPNSSLSPTSNPTAASYVAKKTNDVVSWARA